MRPQYLLILVLAFSFWNNPQLCLKLGEKEKAPLLNESMLSVMVVQCSNGYEYGMTGYEINPAIERELSLYEEVHVKPFPLKTLMGVAYQGVFDKKYCGPIIEKVDVDFLIMTRFESGDKLWGYSTKILNTKTMEQINSIGTTKLNSYKNIGEHIKANSFSMLTDIRDLR